MRAKGLPTLHEDKLNAILTNVCHYYGVDKNVVTSKCRRADLVYARAVICYVARKKFEMTCTATGSLIGGRDHATVIHLLKVIDKKASNSEAIKNNLESVVAYCEKNMGVSEIDLIDLKIAELIAKRAKLV